LDHPRDDRIFFPVDSGQAGFEKSTYFFVILPVDKSLFEPNSA
jgi:hypothetical protein